MHGFRKLPSWWMRDDLALKRFKGGRHLGNSIAALKILLAITVMCEVDGMFARVPYSVLMRITGLSRPMLPRGISLLEDSGLIQVDRSGHSSTYHLMTSPADLGWAKVPCIKVQEALAGLPNRGEAGLSALKIYIYLLAVRPNHVRHVFASYTMIRKRTGLQQKWVRPGLDILFSHLLIHIQKVEELDEMARIEKANNKYTVQGDLRLSAA
ncbi:hypothetical protein [Halomonas korlensis]|uniref:Uncharacterized protein n=1 Tax=Halomonas korlensis TaxID=463301 RepID=A0A1I7KM61_9GAMM|nr:hypothetical protein [Halomonas korlensis]SFU98495.1 hypothetical protein SAMN04487955_12615 [Halomonas korlensis]